MDLKTRLSNLIKEGRYTQREIANKCGIDESLVSRFIRGKRVPTIDTLIKMSQALNLSTDYLLGLSDNTNQETFSQELQLRYIRNLENELEELIGGDKIKERISDVQIKTLTEICSKAEERREF